MISDCKAMGIGDAIAILRRPGIALSDDEMLFNQAVCKLRARVEHPFRVIKRQFDLTQVRYHGLAKNAARLHALFALANLLMARRSLLADTG